jgi:hypothetical protein
MHYEAEASSQRTGTPLAALLRQPSRPNMGENGKAARVRCLFLALAISIVAIPVVHGQDFKKQVIYQVVTDRFYDGDTTNDNPAESPGLYDSTKTQWQAYWGGDLAGIQQQLSYIKGMGATAIWISPPVNNENLNDVSSGISAPYHGYWNRDFTQIEEHFGDNSNSFSAFDSLVSAMHANGMKIIVDQANNHSNPNQSGEFGSLYNNGTFMAAANNDPNGYFHHNPQIPNSGFSDRYQVQYWTLDDLTDLNQENAVIDAYLKTRRLNYKPTMLTHSVSTQLSTSPGAGSIPSPMRSSTTHPAFFMANGTRTTPVIRSIRTLTSLPMTAASRCWIFHSINPYAMCSQATAHSTKSTRPSTPRTETSPTRMILSLSLTARTSPAC